MPGRFNNQTIVITGAGGGIGRAAAVRFSAEGANVVAVDVREEPLRETIRLVEVAGGAGVTVPGDVTKAVDFARIGEEATRQFGGIDFLFNNAGIEGAVSPLVAYPEDVFDRVMAINVKGVWLGIKTIAPLIKARGGGAIVNTASIAGLTGTPSMVGYGASKHAVVGMTKTAARELAADGIRVNAICPGYVETRMMDSIEEGMNPADPNKMKQRIASTVPLKRYASPEEIAGVVAYLCSPDAAYITGAILPIDGGRMA